MACPLKSMAEADLESRKELFESLYEHFAAAIYGFSYRLLGNPEEARDLTQETFFRLFQAMDGGPPIDNPKSWLYAVAANLCTNQLKKKAQRRRGTGFTDRNGRSQEEELVIRQESELLRRCLSRLDKRDQILLMLYGNDLSYAEMSRATGLKTSSIGKTLARAIEKLARLVKEGENSWHA
jgi:RNA polymerase sigma-70 factor (ECF subfamily)